MTDRYAVFGNPVAHSQSPWIHARFAEQTGQVLRYDRQEIPLDGFAAAVKRFFDASGRGLNITVPFKEEAWALCPKRSPRAESAGAVNTIKALPAGGLYGDNTDGVGLLRDITVNLSRPVDAARVLVLGAGGAVRGVLRPLLEARPAGLQIANRTVARAQALVDELPAGSPVLASSFRECAGGRFDIVINATSTGLSGEMPTLPEGLFAATGSLAYDMVYGPHPTAFMEWAAANGAARTSDGLGMLVEQAAESFHLWRDVRPLTPPVIDGLRRRLAGAG